MVKDSVLKYFAAVDLDEVEQRVLAAYPQAWRLPEASLLVDGAVWVDETSGLVWVASADDGEYPVAVYTAGDAAVLDNFVIPAEAGVSKGLEEELVTLRRIAKDRYEVLPA